MDFLSYSILGNTVESLLFALAVFVGVYFVFWIIKKLMQLKVEAYIRNSKTNIDDIFYDLILSFLTVGGLFSAFLSAQRFLVFTKDVDAVVSKVLVVLGAIFATYLLQSFLLRALDEYFKHVNKSASRSLLPFIKNILKLFLWAISAIFILGNLGYSIASLAAGLGIGGLAIALAIQPTLEAFFASVSIFTDKPFQIGDMIRFGDYAGTVKRIGIRTSTVQTFSGTELIVPNRDLTTATLENITKRAGERIDGSVGVVYDTSSADLEKAVKIIQDILKKQKGVEDDIRVWFDSFGDSALIIQFTYFINAEIVFIERKQTISNINFSIKKEYEKAGLDMAFPTQTLYVKGLEK